MYSTVLLAHCTSRSLTLPGTSGHLDRLCRKGEAGDLLTRHDSLTSCEIERFWRCLDCEISHQQKLQVALA